MRLATTRPGQSRGFLFGEPQAQDLKPRLGPRQRGVGGGGCLAGFKIALSGVRKLPESTQVFAPRWERDMICF
jgi:hypothetical protein